MSKCNEQEDQTIPLSAIHSSDLEDTIESIWLQVKSVIASYLKKLDQELDGAVEMTLKQQITSLSKKNSPVRQLMWNRLVAYVRLVKAGTTLPPAPPGFTDFNDDLQSLANQFKRLTVYNYSVFGEHMEKLLAQMSEHSYDVAELSQKDTTAEKEATAGSSRTDSE